MSKSAATVKEAAGITVYLLEELGDARLRCMQLKKYVKEATDLVEKSSHRDHFFEVAAHLIHGIPDTLFKMEKALDASALAAARIDYEEIKNNLKPEKADELEDALQDVRLRYLQRRSEGGTPPAESAPKAEAKNANEGEMLAAKPTPKLDQNRVKAWMRQNIHRVIDPKTGEANMTQLAEEAASNLDLHAGNDIPEEVFEWAMEVADATGHGVRASRKDTSMTPKEAADQFLAIATQTETTGRVPLSKVITLLARLEGRDKRATVPAAKAATLFRQIATDIANPAQGKAPSRLALANILRNVIADQMQPTSAAVAAAIYQTANSRDEVMKGFKEANPSMSEEDLQKAADMWEKHKHVVKDQHK